MYVNREEYLILAATVGALAHLLTETGDCWNRAIGVRSSSAEATSPGREGGRRCRNVTR